MAKSTARSTKPAQSSRLDEIKICWSLGYSYQQIAERFDLTHAAATKLVHGSSGLGLALQYKLKEQDYVDMRKLYDVDRWTYAEIANQYGVGQGTVRFHLARVGAKLRRRGWSARVDKRAKTAGIKSR